jgi:hypothetical protein
MNQLLSNDERRTLIEEKYFIQERLREIEEQLEMDSRIREYNQSPIILITSSTLIIHQQIIV